VEPRQVTADRACTNPVPWHDIVPLVAPGPDVPRNRAGYIGFWNGRLDAQAIRTAINRPIPLAVTQITGEQARVVLAGGEWSVPGQNAPFFALAAAQFRPEASSNGEAIRNGSSNSATTDAHQRD